MKIAIAGYGMEGESSYRYWAADPNNTITIVDQKQPTRTIPANASTIIGEKASESLENFDLVVRTAGLAPRKIRTDGKIWSATNEFFKKCPADIIGITGTKGKGTTASLIASIFEAAGKKVWLVGNIGKPALDILQQVRSDDVVVYELSSFQLWDLKYSPHVAVVLLVEPEHLDVHTDFSEYINAKANIRKHQKLGDLCVFHPTNSNSRKIAHTSNRGRAIRYSICEDGGACVKTSNFYEREHKICSVNALQLIGQHNVENACAAISVARFYNISDNNIEAGLKIFKGLPHRLECVRKVDGVRYYNDSFSSSPPSTVAAIRSFNQPQILILGGIDRGGDFSEISDAIKLQTNVKSVIVIGEIREKLTNILQIVNPDLHIESCELTSMKEIVNLAKSIAKPNDAVVLSPGCASFDMFEDFYDRGNQFKEAVNKL